MTKPLISLIKDRHPAAAIEYCMIGALISVLVVAGATGLGVGLQSKFVPVSTGLT